MLDLDLSKEYLICSKLINESKNTNLKVKILLEKFDFQILNSQIFDLYFLISLISMQKVFYYKEVRKSNFYLDFFF